MTLAMPVEDALRIDRSAKTLRELAVERLRDAILDGQLRPGERLVERVLCERLGVSRTVVREALRHLETEGLVDVVPQQGPAVARLDAGQAAQIYEIRAMLEALAARAAAERATPADIKALTKANADIQAAFAGGHGRDIVKATSDWYELMFRIADKPMAWQVVQGLNARISQLRAVTVSQPGRAADAGAEMERIIGAIAAGDGEAAAQASFAHLDRVKQLAAAALKAG